MARSPKKSESLEIRIPHGVKTAFMERCRAEGVSASETVRGYIEAHLAPPRAAASDRRLWLRLGAGIAAAAGLGATALPSLARPLERVHFERLDANGDGVLVAAELDRDGDGAISFAEFRRR